MKARTTKRADRARKRELAEQSNPWLCRFWAKAWLRAAEKAVKAAKADSSCPVVAPSVAIYLDGAVWTPSNVDPSCATRILTNPNWRL